MFTETRLRVSEHTVRDKLVLVYLALPCSSFGELLTLATVRRAARAAAALGRKKDTGLKPSQSSLSSHLTMMVTPAMSMALKMNCSS